MNNYQIDNPKIRFMRNPEYYIKSVNNLPVAVVTDFFHKENNKPQYSSI